MELDTESEAISVTILPPKSNEFVEVEQVNLNTNQIDHNSFQDTTHFEDKGNMINQSIPAFPEKPKQIEVDKIADKLITCSSTATSCRFPVLKGFGFCHKHILEDKASPYQRCSFILNKDDNKGCLSPAPKNGIFHFFPHFYFINIGYRRKTF